MGIERSQRGEVSRQVRDHHLKETGGTLEVVEASDPQIAQAHWGWQFLLEQLARALGKQDLPAMASAHDAGSAMHIQTHVAVRGTLWFTGVQAHAHAHKHVLRPGMRGEGALHLHRCTDRLAGASEGHEEAISLRVDLVAAARMERGTHQGSILLQHVGVALAQVLKQPGRPLDVAEEERDGAHREVVHTESPSLWLEETHPQSLSQCDVGL